MKLFIRISDGQPIDHPIIESNLVKAFPEIDTDNLPEEFAYFERSEIRQANPYEVFVGSSYEMVDGIVKEVHQFESMSEEEKQDKINRTINAWTENGGFASWIFDQETCSYLPPTPYPDDGKLYVWDEETIAWVEPEQ